MALFTISFESRCLNGNTQINVIMPDCPREKTPAEFYGSGRKYKVLWLLHGTFGDHTDWLRKSNIELYACERDLIVVMPNGMNSNYGNWPHFSLGYNMYDFLFDELMPFIYNWLPASSKREDNYIAGLSMGGRGTCVYAFSRPELFAGAAILSATPYDFAGIMEATTGMQARMKKSVANYDSLEEFLNGPENSWKNVTEKAATGELPKLYFSTGGDDGVMNGLTPFMEHAKKIGLEATFEIIPGFSHEWRFWDLAIQNAMDHFGLFRDENAGNPY